MASQTRSLPCTVFSQRHPRIISQDKETVQAGGSEGCPVMSPHEGRIEKRVRLAVPLELSKLRDAGHTEHTITENVCSNGVRVTTRRAMEPSERLMVRSCEIELQTQVRVAYCQQLTDGRYGVGLQFQGLAFNFLSAGRRGSQNQG
jgi:hypothetical protein